MKIINNRQLNKQKNVEDNGKLSIRDTQIK